MTEAIRVYLSKRIDFLLIEINTAHSEIQVLNNLLKDLHNNERDRLQVDTPVPRSATNRPPLVSTRSESNLRPTRQDAAASVSAIPLPLHPAHRAGVNSQSMT